MLTTVAVLGSDQTSRSSISRLLLAQRQFIVVEVGDFSEQDLARLSHLAPDITVCELPSSASVRLLEQIRAAAPKSKLLVLDPPKDESILLRLIESGASAFAPKSDEVCSCIASTLNGELRCSGRLAAAMARRILELRLTLMHQRMRPDELSPRELDVVRLIENGLSNKEIAVRLRIELATVKNHVHRILRKMAVHHRSHINLERTNVRSSQTGSPNDGPDTEIH